jgi:hypothetical protein
VSRIITLTRGAQQPVVNETTTCGYTFQVTAQGNGMPSEVFVMNQRPEDPNAAYPTPTDDFIGVATIADLVLPINGPEPPDTRFRVAQITVTYETEQEGNNAWTLIQVLVNSLRVALNLADNLNISQVVQFGP